jgi:hypothetical protein
LTFSCSKEPDDNKIDTGSLIGNVKLYDKYGNENLTYNDVTIELVDSNKKSIIIYPDLNGKFYIDSLLKGNILVTIDKQGYGGINTISFSHTKNIDTLSKIILLEEIPFSYTNFWFNFASGKLYFKNSTDYVTEDNFMVGNFLCFSKYSNVSRNLCELTYNTGVASNVRFINSTGTISITYPIDIFLTSGFNHGDTFYIVDYPVVDMFYLIINDSKQNFNIVSYKMNNPSNVYSFVLN